MKILVLEPYFDGSHQAFLAGLRKHLDFEFDLMTLPAQKWKWRMRLAAPYFAERLKENRTPAKYDRILCSSFVDVAAFRSLAGRRIQNIPLYTYFHENQFVYPVRKQDKRDLHFGLTNLTTFLASDRVAFNSRYNLETFVHGVEMIMKICPDMKFAGLEKTLRDKAEILYPGIDFSDFPEQETKMMTPGGTLVIVWNHRWEHDKDPEYFFETLYGLDRQDCDFRLIVMGQSFRQKPAVFAEARQKLAHRIDHFGFVKSRKEYIEQLGRADLVISTARHEFYGISVIEAVRAGCMPLLPDRLSYPELFPAEFLYGEGELLNRLQSLCRDPNRFEKLDTESLTRPYAWPALRKKYLAWFAG